jgi:hypothetical protein
VQWFDVAVLEATRWRRRNSIVTHLPDAPASSLTKCKHLLELGDCHQEIYLEVQNSLAPSYGPETSAHLRGPQMRDTKYMCELYGRGGEVHKPCLSFEGFVSHS